MVLTLLQTWVSLLCTRLSSRLDLLVRHGAPVTVCRVLLTRRWFLLATTIRKVLLKWWLSLDLSNEWWHLLRQWARPLLMSTLLARTCWCKVLLPLCLLSMSLCRLTGMLCSAPRTMVTMLLIRDLSSAVRRPFRRTCPTLRPCLPTLWPRSPTCLLGLVASRTCVRLTLTTTSPVRVLDRVCDLLLSSSSVLTVWRVWVAKWQRNWREVVLREPVS